MNSRAGRLVEFLVLAVGAAALVVSLGLAAALVYAPGWAQLAFQGRAYWVLGAAAGVWLGCGAAFALLPPACQGGAFRRKKAGRHRSEGGGV